MGDPKHAFLFPKVQPNALIQGPLHMYEHLY
jgi:hypothetical protein